MSHFSVAVFTDEYTSVEDLLNRYDESLVVDKYMIHTKKELINRGKTEIKHLRNIYKEYRKDKTKYRRKVKNNTKHLRFIKKIPSMLKWNDERIYKFATRFYSEDDLDKEGNAYSTYNPESKWDWYEIGRKMERNAYSW